MMIRWNVKWHAKSAKPFCAPQSWQQLPQGKAYCSALEVALAPWLAKIGGYQILKLGALSTEVTTNLPMRHQILLSEKTLPNSTALTPNDSFVQAELTALPFIQQEINAVFLTNCLNFTQDPHQVLREVHRVLADDGWLFLSLFNPLSSLICKNKLGEFPFRRYSTWRIIDWLELLNFEILERQNLSITGQRAHLFSPLILIVAQKRTYPLTFNTEKERTTMPIFLQPTEAFKTNA